MNMQSLIVIAVLAGAAGNFEHSSDTSCGKACCYLLLNELGKQVRLADFSDQFPAHDADTSSDGESILHLQHVLRQHGVATRGLRLQWNDVVQLGRPAIIHLSDPGSRTGHFVVVTYRDGKTVILDPMQAVPLRASDAKVALRLRDLYSGHLLVSDEWSLFLTNWRIRLALLTGCAIVCVAFVRWRRPASVNFRKKGGFGNEFADI